MGPVPEPAVVIGPLKGSGITTLHIGAGNRAMVALEPGDDGPAGSSDRSIASTGYTANADLTPLRIPRLVGDRAVLTSRVLVVAMKTAAKAEAVRGTQTVATVDLAAGVGVLSFAIGGADQVRVLDASGNLLAQTAFVEAASGPRIFGDQLIRDWS